MHHGRRVADIQEPLFITPAALQLYRLTIQEQPGNQNAPFQAVVNGTTPPDFAPNSIPLNVWNAALGVNVRPIQATGPRSLHRTIISNPYDEEISSAPATFTGGVLFILALALLGAS